MTDSFAGAAVPFVPVTMFADLQQRLVRISTAFAQEGNDGLIVQTLDTRSLLDQFSEEVYITDGMGRLVFANAAAMKRMRAGSSADLSVDFVIDEEAQARQRLEHQLMSSGLTDEREERIVDAEGRTVWLFTVRTPLRNDNGQVVGLMVMSRDVTDRKKQEAIQSANAANLDMIARGKPLPDVLDAICRSVQQPLDGVYASILLLEEDGECLRHGAAPDLPPAYTRLIDGVRIGPRVGSCGTAAWRRTPVIVRDIQTDPLWSDFKEIASLFGLRSCWSTPLLGSDGAVLGTFALYSAAVREPTEWEMEFTTMACDLAGIAIERARTERRLRHLAHHDPLTGLPNRALFWPQFSRALHEARRERRKITVAYIDLDNFKQINDAFGHAVGDEVLKVIAQRVTESVRSSDLVVRLGGDEFAIVFSNAVQDEENVLRRLSEVRALISAPIEMEDGQLRATASMGVSFFPQDGSTPEELLAQADAAMYGAKAAGRDTLEAARSKAPV